MRSTIRIPRTAAAAAVGVLLCAQMSLAGESKLLAKLGAVLPTFTEVGFLTNVVNVYKQVSSFVRATNKVFRSVQDAKQEWDYIRGQIDDMFARVENLAEIDPYDMDTWASTINQAQMIIHNDVRDIVHSFNMLEFYTLDAGLDYMQRLEEIKDYDVRNQQNRRVVNDYYLTRQYIEELERFRSALSSYQGNTVTVLRAEYSALAQELGAEENPAKRAELIGRMSSLEKEIKGLEDAIASSYACRTKLDSLLDMAADVMAVNLTEIQSATQRVMRTEESLANLMEAYHKLENGQVHTLRKEDYEAAMNVLVDMSDYDATDPDKVPPPETPEEVEPGTTRKKTVSTQDIVNLQNAINFLMLKQETLYRDIEIMKCNSMAFVLALEAYKQNAPEVTAFAVAHRNKVFNQRMNELEGVL